MRIDTEQTGDKENHQWAEELAAWMAAHRAELLRLFRPYAEKALGTGANRKDSVDELYAEVARWAMEHVAEWQPERGTTRAWIMRVAVNIAKQWCDKRLRRKTRTASEWENASPHESESTEDFWERLSSAPTPGPDGPILLADWARDVLEHALPDDREIVELVILADIPMPQVAERLQITEGAARVRLHRALKKMKAYAHRLDVEAVGSIVPSALTGGKR
jgi:RNA polymerase sigma factor (sigma-70 family)